ncbi:MAG: DDE-type integrase/transposase/recombinase [Candidatus Subteraquimicrobiales bacterium]|nr:DDE-type integrase/transposase/recombinase [Candidatus Subteraquimicrobiales bacterium]
MTLARSRKRVSEIFEVTVKAFSTIWYWTKRFASQTSRIIEGLAERLHCDETLIKTFRKHKLPYFWAVKCPATKAIVGWHLSEHRTPRDAKLLFWEARRKFPIGYFPKAIRTDSMPAYRFAISKVLKEPFGMTKTL